MRPPLFSFAIGDTSRSLVFSCYVFLSSSPLLIRTCGKVVLLLVNGKTWPFAVLPPSFWRLLLQDSMSLFSSPSSIADKAACRTCGLLRVGKDWEMVDFFPSITFRCTVFFPSSTAPTLPKNSTSGFLFSPYIGFFSPPTSSTLPKWRSSCL